MINNTTLRALSLGVALGLVIAVVPSCGTKPPTAKCNRNTCAGCCDESGACFTGVATDACGVDGITCLVCKTGQTCAVGQCRNGVGGGSGGGSGGGGGVGGGAAGGGAGGGSGGGSGVGGGTGGGSGVGGGTGGGSGVGGGTGGGSAQCSNLNCPNGCCDPVNGSCRVGDSNTACGAGGLACKVCNTGVGQMCTNNQCTGGQCDSTTCPTGCCSGNTCVTPPTTSQCGVGGSTCVTCQGAATCDLDAGACTGGGAGGGAGGAGGGFGVGGGFGGAGGGTPSLCSPACATGECCDVAFCTPPGQMCIFTGIFTPGAKCQANGACAP